MQSAERVLYMYDTIVIKNENITRNELCEKFDVSLKTIERSTKAINRYIYPKRIREDKKTKYLKVITLSEDEML
jgi:transcriptional antiterminator